MNFGARAKLVLNWTYNEEKEREESRMKLPDLELEQLGG